MLIRLAVCIAAVSALVASAPAGAQSAGSVPRIGVLWQTPPPPPVHPHLAALFRNLRDLGWQEGKTIEVEYRYGGNDAARLRALAADLVRSKVDLITTAGDLSTRAAQQATRSIPIVALVGHPVESGFAASLARPGGNITGFAVLADELALKRLELLKEMVPKLTRVAVLWDPVTHERQPRMVEAAAGTLGLEVETVRAASAAELPGAFEAAQRARAEAMLVLISPMFIGARTELTRLAATHRLPAMYHTPAFTEVGGLIAYGPSLDEQWRQVAGIIDRILRGARVADLPFQQPTRFELDVNLRAARAIGIEVPRSILLRADRVVD
ncbi:ABC transporter substrate-binding protein [Betaproteobacteria bacterium PRO7]|jgi:putative ABC transport system substrate-binding protein|nr:ABC transporter substrate-binding protein [Burkholderiaceae bacterium]MDL1861729.1 ABC transporter substrate-binding protein [Betaproteobacteria bacterium PRO7]GIL06583.1 MAG: ABC transporter substrate-binding protein [Betaproteobacteria bacterium]